MTNQLWNYWHDKAEQLEKENQLLKAKLEDAEERADNEHAGWVIEMAHSERKWNECIKLRAEVERLKKLCCEICPLHACESCPWNLKRPDKEDRER